MRALFNHWAGRLADALRTPGPVDRTQIPAEADPQGRQRPAQTPATARRADARRTPGPVVLSLLGWLLLAALFTAWWIAHPGTSAVSRLAALASCLLAGAVYGRWIPRAVSDFRGPGASVRPAQPRGPGRITLRRQTLRVFLTLLAVGAGMPLLVYLLQILSGSLDPFPQALDIWRSTDGAHYLDIARDGYLQTGEWGRLVQLVFLPGYPLAIRAMRLLVSNELYAAMLVSALCFAAGGTLFYRLLRLDAAEDDAHAFALRGVRYLCLLPGAFFFIAPLSEGLFLLLSVACLYALRRRRWGLAGLMGGLAAFTRSTGVVLLVPALWEAARYLRATALTPPSTPRRALAARLRRWGPLAAALLIPAGFGAYCLINYAVAANPLQFMTYQRVHWHQGLGLFFNTAAYQMGYAVESFRNLSLDRALGLWTPSLLCGFGSLVLMAWAAPRLRASDTAYFMAYYAVAMGATRLLSAPRYLLVALPLPMALAHLTRNRARDGVLTIALTVFQVVYAWLFVNHWCVY